MLVSKVQYMKSIMQAMRLTCIRKAALNKLIHIHGVIPILHLRCKGQATFSRLF